MRNAKNIYDCNDFKTVVASKGSCCVPLEQFIDFPNASNQNKAKPKLRSAVPSRRNKHVLEKGI